MELLPQRPGSLSRHRRRLQRQGRPVPLVSHRRHTVGSRSRREWQDRRLEANLPLRGGRSRYRSTAESRRRTLCHIAPNDGEVDSLGLGGTMKDRVTKDVREAESTFAKFAKSQKVGQQRNQVPRLRGQSSRHRAGGHRRIEKRPGGLRKRGRLGAQQRNLRTGLSGHDGADGNTWRTLGLPQLGETAATASMFTFRLPSATTAASAGGEAPTAEMQELMTELEKLDTQPGGDNQQQIEAIAKRRIEILGKLAAASPAGADREQWQRQQADMLSAAVQTLQYFDAIGELEKAGRRSSRVQKASEELLAHVEFRRLWSEYIKAQFDPKADYAKIRDAGSSRYKSCAQDYPNFPDTAEALLQLVWSKSLPAKKRGP